MTIEEIKHQNLLAKNREYYNKNKVKFSLKNAAYNRKSKYEKEYIKALPKKLILIINNQIEIASGYIDFNRKVESLNYLYELLYKIQNEDKENFNE